MIRRRASLVYRALSIIVVAGLVLTLPVVVPPRWVYADEVEDLVQKEIEKQRQQLVAQNPTMSADVVNIIMNQRESVLNRAVSDMQAKDESDPAKVVSGAMNLPEYKEAPVVKDTAGFIKNDPQIQSIGAPSAPSQADPAGTAPAGPTENTTTTAGPTENTTGTSTGPTVNTTTTGDTSTTGAGGSSNTGASDSPDVVVTVPARAPGPCPFGSLCPLPSDHQDRTITTDDLARVFGSEEDFAVGPCIVNLATVGVTGGDAFLACADAAGRWEQKQQEEEEAARNRQRIDEGMPITPPTGSMCLEPVQGGPGNAVPHLWASVTSPDAQLGSYLEIGSFGGERLASVTPPDPVTATLNDIGSFWDGVVASVAEWCPCGGKDNMGNGNKGGKKNNGGNNDDDDDDDDEDDKKKKKKNKNNDDNDNDDDESPVAQPPVIIASSPPPPTTSNC